MKKNYILLLLLAFFSVNFINAQFNCPASVGNQSTVSTLHFKITAGTCADYPSPILVAEAGNIATYVLASCNGTNLKYDFQSGDTLPSADTFTVDFNPNGLCGYLNGLLIVLSNNDVSLNDSVSIFPNPLMKNGQLTIKLATSINAKVYMYDVTGKLTITDEIDNVNRKQINTSILTNGVYFLKLVTEDNITITRKVIIMK